MYRIKKAKLAGGILAGIGLGLLLYRPATGLSGATVGLQLSIGVLIPTLFPYLCCCSVLLSSPLPEQLSRLLGRPFSWLFALPATLCCPFLLGCLAGYPVGAKMVSETTLQGRCGRQEGERALRFFVNCGPSFLLGAVGVGLLGNARAGWLLLGCHLAAALLVGILNRPADAKKPSSCTAFPPPPIQPQPLGQVIQESFFAVLGICAQVVFFSAILAVLKEIGILSLVAVIMRSYLPCFSLEGWQALLQGIVELTCGVNAAAALSGAERMVLLSFLTSFGGLCVLMQASLFCRPAGLSIWHMAAGKALQGLISAFFIFAFYELCPGMLGDLTVFAPAATGSMTIVAPVLELILLWGASGILCALFGKGRSKNKLNMLS